MSKYVSYKNWEKIWCPMCHNEDFETSEVENYRNPIEVSCSNCGQTLRFTCTLMIKKAEDD